MLLNGVNHVAILTHDTDRLVAFYREVFAELNVFQIEGNTEAGRQAPMFGRGRIDHLGLQAASLGAFDQIRDRLIAQGASDRFVTDFGPVLSVFFRDPDGLEGEVCIQNPDAVPGVHNPPGTPAARYATR